MVGFGRTAVKDAGALGKITDQSAIQSGGTSEWWNSDSFAIPTRSPPVLWSSYRPHRFTKAS